MSIGPVNLLLVDDDERNLLVFESTLSATDIVFVRAKTAQEALMALVEGEFAAIVLDIRLPDMNGIELAVLIKQRKKTQNVPILFLTAFYQEDKDALNGYEAGAVDYLTKPINPAILRSKINVFVELFRKSRELAMLNQNLEKAEQALIQANAELEGRIQERTAELTKANHAKDNFLAAISHELRTPLNPILLEASDAAEDKDLPEAIRSRFASIAKNALIEARLIDDLLDLTRISHGKLKLDKRPINIYEVFRDAFATVEPDIKAKELRIVTESGSSQTFLLGDPVRLQQIFWNILKNAVKFTPPNGKIAIEIMPNSNSENVLIKIRDSGIGMTEEEICNAFGAFSQGEHFNADSPSPYGGLGLGLAITHTLVAMHGGTIRAESAGRDQGATFILEFPIIKEPNGASP
jgi:signal transduction histidine kinase